MVILIKREKKSQKADHPDNARVGNEMEEKKNREVQSMSELFVKNTFQMERMKNKKKIELRLEM